MAFLEATSITKQYGNQLVLDQLDFSLEKKQILAVLGRSGCGKTTLLKILAGLVTPDRGSVRVEGQPIQERPLPERGALYLYQEALLFPHLTVEENLGYGLKVRKQPKPQIAQQTERMLYDLELSAHARQLPSQLSGGQRQRVALGRALLVQPRLLLLDEPFGALDAETRSNMQLFFKKIAQHYQITAIFVTHDLKEAVTMGQQWALMEKGQLTHYQQLKDFSKDPKTGLQQEIAFWKNIDHQL